MFSLFDDKAGAYYPSYMLMKIDSSIDFDNFEGNKDEQKGTFMHEYCHFIQDISTTYGYMTYIYNLQELLLKLHLIDVSGSGAVQLNRDFYTFFRGYDSVKDSLVFINKIRIQEDTDYKAEYGKEDWEYVNVTYNGNKEFVFGGLCIAESMAYLSEKRLYEVQVRENQFPYNICQLICEKEYPEIADDMIVLALCEFSLLERNSGVFFVKLLRRMKKEKFLPKDVREVEKYVSENYAIGFRGIKQRIEDILECLYPGEITEFKDIKEWVMSRFILGCELREKSNIFLSLCLCPEDIHIRYGCIQAVMNLLEFPILIDKNNFFYSGAYKSGKDIDARYLLGPFILYEMLDGDGRITERECPLLDMCSSMEGYRGCKYLHDVSLSGCDENCILNLFCKLYSISFDECR
ncbi:MAG: hypothetical protein NC427_02365 [Ruminococcus flavefaciens]|nr:hypothetical protein [Ruminococcus flavefaciens]